MLDNLFTLIQESIMKGFVFFLLFLMIFLPVYLLGEEKRCERKGVKMEQKEWEQNMEKRIHDLLEQMTLSEKAAEMTHDSPGIERLGIPSYNWWNECLHGVARSGIATVFPQAVGLAATWNLSLIEQAGKAIALEARAKHHEAVRKGERGIYQGLTFWTPNINIFRDPRWGRGQETYGEDPYLTSLIASVFVNALQGDDSRYYQVIATLKHFAVHSGPEKLRHVFDVHVTEQDLRETYLYAFEKVIQKAEPYSIMGAYNRLYGEPCCSSPFLLQEILRQEWGFDGYVVSDCGAIYDIWKNHQTVKTPEEAAARAVKAGCDLNCGDVYLSLMKALDLGYIHEKEIDQSLKRLLRAKMKLGLFDSPEENPYSSIPYEVVDCKEHQELAERAGLESMVLLKNENHFLPFQDTIKRITVIGPNAENIDVLLGNYHGTPSDPITFLQGIKDEFHEKEIVYKKGCSLYRKEESDLVSVSEDFLWHRDSENRKQKGLIGYYYDNKNLENQPVFTRIDSSIDFHWRTDGPENLPNESFSARWEGELIPPVSGEYVLGVSSDDGFRLYLNGKLLLDDWNYHSYTQKDTTVLFESGKIYSICLEYFEGSGDAAVSLGWLKPGDKENQRKLQQEMLKKTITAAAGSDAVIFCGGISPSMEGEEMNIDIDGFQGGDRTHLYLPDIQLELLEELNQLDIPIVLVLSNGGALSFPKDMKNVKSVIETWYPGQKGGTALAKILKGDYNPSGKLPVTFYTSLKDFPDFADYEMKTQTYRLYPDSVLFPFGFGLSYTSFEYSSLTFSKKMITSKDTLSISFQLKNSGAAAGMETPQLYLLNLKSGEKVYLKTLRGFQKVFLNIGEVKKIEFQLTSEDLEIWETGSGWKVNPGLYIIGIGSSSRDILLTGEFEYR